MKRFPRALDIFLAFLFFAGGLFIVTQTTRQAIRAHQIASWPATPCVIESAEVTDQPDGYALTVRYRYTVNGATHISDQYGPDPQHTFENLSQRQPLLDRYAPGTTNTCHVNPADPTHAILDNTFPILPTLGALAFSLVFASFGAFIFFSTLFKKTTKKSPSKCSTCFFAALFILVGFAATAHFFVKPYLLARQARDWPSVKATVTHHTHRLHIAYRYTFNNQTYESDRYTFEKTSESDFTTQADIAARYPDGSEIDVFVNPRDPSFSVINRDISASIYIRLFPLFFVAAGLMILIPALLQFISLRQASCLPSNAKAFTRTDTPAGRLAGILFAALFWNSIVAVFLISDIQSWQRGQRPIIETLFLIPFVLVGLWLVFVVIQTFLRFFTPRVELAPFAPLTYGSTTSVTYTITGNLARLAKLTVTLICDVAIPDESNDPYVASHKTILLETDAPLITETGLISVSIPDKSALLESPDDYPTVWKLTFRGTIPFWPDMLETFTLNIV